MRAVDLAEPFPVVRLTTDAATAARMIGEGRLAGLIVCEEDGTPHTVLDGSQVVRFMIPEYVQEDPKLALVYGEDAATQLVDRMATKTVQDILPRRHDRTELPVVDGDATTIEIAAVMARMHSPLVAVLDEDGKVAGVVTASRLLERIFADRAAGSEDAAS